MENNKERIINSSLMDIYEEEEKHRRKKNEDLKRLNAEVEEISK